MTQPMKFQVHVHCTCHNVHRCCTSRITRLPSCTHPLTQHATYKESEFCPSPPQISIQDLINNSTVGPLDTYTPYVDEVLMRLSDDVTAPVFTRRVMGGFVVQYKRDPPYSVCGRSDTDEVCRSLFRSLQPCNETAHPVYVAPLPNLIPLQNGSCPGLDTLSYNSPGNNGGYGDGVSGDGGSGDGVSGDGVSGEGVSGEGVSGDDGCESLQPGYEMDGLGADILNAGMCDCENVIGCEDGEGVMGCGCEVNMSYVLYHNESQEFLSVTVWYNNRVSMDYY